MRPASARAAGADAGGEMVAACPIAAPPEEVNVRRKNPIAGSVSLGQLIVREVRLGGDDDALHTVRGQMVLDGDIDTVVLRVKESAEVERLLLVRRLEVGVPAGNAYGSGGYPSGGYPSDAGAVGGGASIDEDGTVRTSGWLVVGDSERGLVLRSPEGKYFGFTVDNEGHLVSAGRFLGWRAP